MKMGLSGIGSSEQARGDVYGVHLPLNFLKQMISNNKSL